MTSICTPASFVGFISYWKYHSSSTVPSGERLPSESANSSCVTRTSATVSSIERDAYSLFSDTE